MKLIVGLGNPGREYIGTRHNMGFAVVDRLAAEWRIDIRQRKFDGVYGEGHVGTCAVYLCKPQTYMNRSGPAVAQFMRWQELAATDLLVIHDELDIPLGRFKFARGRGAAGHRGVVSVAEALGTTHFDRLRVGIDRPSTGIDPTEYVLQGFTTAEQTAASEAVERAVAALQTYVRYGMARAMERFHGGSAKEG